MAERCWGFGQAYADASRWGGRCFAGGAGCGARMGTAFERYWGKMAEHRELTVLQGLIKKRFGEEGLRIVVIWPGGLVADILLSIFYEFG